VKRNALHTARAVKRSRIDPPALIASNTQVWARVLRRARPPVLDFSRSALWDATLHGHIRVPKIFNRTDHSTFAPTHPTAQKSVDVFSDAQLTKN